jgi:hypothetical protein
MIDPALYPICVFCGRSWQVINMNRANLLAQPGVWACDDHLRTDGWQNIPHEAPPFDAGYPYPTGTTPLHTL